MWWKKISYTLYAVLLISSSVLSNIYIQSHDTYALTLQECRSLYDQKETSPEITNSENFKNCKAAGHCSVRITQLGDIITCLDDPRTTPDTEGLTLQQCITNFDGKKYSDEIANSPDYKYCEKQRHCYVKTIPTEKSFRCNDINNRAVQVAQNEDDIDVEIVLNASTKEECEGKNGKWNDEKKQCIGDSSITSGCPIAWLGWILCPVIHFAGSIADKSFLVLEELLVVKTTTDSGAQDSLQKVWSVALGIANALFIVAFLVVVFSQISGRGISNYGIKVIFPRLLLTAVLINFSFWLCLLLVDISNLLGTNIYDIIINLREQIIATTPADAKTNGILTNTMAGVAIAATLGLSAGLIYPAISVLLPALGALVIAIMAIIITLFIRQALVVVLIVISPIAFAAYLLPNTEKLFKTWWTLFKMILIVYPIIALTYGLSQLTAQLLLTVSEGAEGALENAILQITALGVVAGGLFTTAIVFRGITELLSKIGANNGVVSGISNGIRSRFGEAGENFDNKKRAQALSKPNASKFLGTGSNYRRKAVKDGRKSFLSSQAERANRSFVAENASNEEALNHSNITKGLDTENKRRVVAGAGAESFKMNEEDVQNIMGEFESKNAGPDDLHDVARDNSKSSAERQAAIAQLSKLNQHNTVAQLFNDAQSGSQADRELFASAMHSAGDGKPKWYGQGLNANFRAGNAGSAEQEVINAINSGQVNAANIPDMHPDELRFYDRVASSDATAGANLNAQTRRILENPNSQARLGKVRGVVEGIAARPYNN